MFCNPGAGQYGSAVEFSLHDAKLEESTRSLEWNWYWSLKRCMDFLCGLFLLVLAAPFIVLTALLVKLTSRGPAYYSQVRLGIGGKPFYIWKLRTMYHNCERLSGPCWSTPKDPRITPIGRFLRRTHIDELPQLWNVVWGEMSLVGPRPERPELIPALERKIAGYRRRLEVRPGMTGLAQLQLPPDTDLESVRRKLFHDLYYIRRLSLSLDLGILLSTPCYLVGLPFALSSWIFRVPSTAKIESAPSDLSVLDEAASPQPTAAPAR